MTKPRDLATLGGGFTQSGTGAIQRTVENKLKDTVSVKDFGAVGNGVTDDTAAIQSAIAACQLSKSALYFGRGTFLVSQLIFTLTSDLDVLLDGGTIKGAAAATVIVSVTGANTRRFSLSGPGTIDASLRTHTPGVGSGSGIDLSRLRSARVSNVFFTGGSLNDGFGDSAINVSYGKDTTITNCVFDGWDDHDIYATGTAWNDVTSSPECCLTITGCVFRNNGSGSIRVAREFRSVIITGNVFDAVHKALIMAGGNTNWNPGNSVSFTGNVIKTCRDVALDCRYFSNGLIISGNLIHDWGSAGGSIVAINLRGVSNCSVTANVIRPSSASVSTGCTNGIYLQSAVNPDLTLGQDGDPSYVWPSSNNIVSSNVVEVVNRGTGGADAACITDNSASILNLFSGNKLSCGYNRFIYTQTAGVQRTQDPQILSHNANGFGIGTADPQTPLDVRGVSRVAVNANDDFIEFTPGTAIATMTSRSPSASAQKLFINATTDVSHTTPSGGAVGLNLRVLNVDKIACNVDDVQIVAPLRLRGYATGSLPTSGIVAGSIAYDSTTSTVKFFNGTVWANI
jgi:hypothetical protein